MAVPDTPERRRLDADLRRRRPGLRALPADARATALGRGDRFAFTGPIDTAVQIVRLVVVTDAFLAVALYRCKTSLLNRRVPVLPRVCHRLAMITGQLTIGDPVVVAPGLCVPHGQVVIDGLTEIGPNVTLSPFVTIGLVAPDFVGPTVGRGCRVGTGAKVIGNITLGPGSVVGANSVVLADVAAGATVVGAPARPVGEGSAP